MIFIFPSHLLFFPKSLSIFSQLPVMFFVPCLCFKLPILPPSVCTFSPNCAKPKKKFSRLQQLSFFILIFATSHVRSPPRVAAGGLILLKRRFQTSVVVSCELRKLNRHNRQMTTKHLRKCVYIYIVIYTYWRGLTALSILCDGGNAKAYSSRMGIETDTCAFFVS